MHNSDRITRQQTALVACLEYLQHSLNGMVDWWPNMVGLAIKRSRVRLLAVSLPKRLWASGSPTGAFITKLYNVVREAKMSSAVTANGVFTRSSKRPANFQP